MEEAGAAIVAWFKGLAGTALNAAIMKAFNKFDVDGSGFLDREEFGKAMLAMGLRLSASQVEVLFKEYDVDGTGTIELQEFTQMVRRYLCVSNGESSLSAEQEKAMKQFDKDGSNDLCEVEFLKMLCVEPMRQMLPEDCRHATEQAVKRYAWQKAQGEKHRRAHMLSADAAAAEAVRQAAQRLFHEADTDGTGYLDRAELEQVACSLWKRLGLPDMSPEQMHAEQLQLRAYLGDVVTRRLAARRTLGEHARAAGAQRRRQLPVREGARLEVGVVERPMNDQRFRRAAHGSVHEESCQAEESEQRAAARRPAVHTVHPRVAKHRSAGGARQQQRERKRSGLD